jgi:hypothetical protein
MYFSTLMCDAWVKDQWNRPRSVGQVGICSTIRNRLHHKIVVYYETMKRELNKKLVYVSVGVMKD